MRPRIYSHEVWEGQDWQPLDLFAYGDGVLPLHSDISGIDLKIFKLPEATVVYQSLAESPGNGVTGPFFNTPILDAGWKQGPPGYNYKRRIEMSVLEPALAVAGLVFEPGQTYRAEITLNGTTEGRLISVHEYTIKGRYGQP